jgi:hypothetical protein
MDDYIISERPARPTYQDIVRGLADEYSQPRKPRPGGHGESIALPLPTVSGASGERSPLAPTYTGGYLRPDEYRMIEGGGREVIQQAMQTYFSVVDGMTVERPAEPDEETAEIPHIPCTVNRTPQPAERRVTPYIGTPQPSDAATSLVIVIAFAVLVAGLLWGAAGMPY